MELRLRNMTGLYLSCREQMLLLYRQGGRVVNDVWVASAGGHFEQEELNDPERCALRELKEELGLGRDSLDHLRLRYIGLRLTGGEIRQNYYYFAELRPEHYHAFTSDEGRCRWVPYGEVLRYEMPLTARAVMEHYLAEGRHTNMIYTAVSGPEGFRFTPLAEK